MICATPEKQAGPCPLLFLASRYFSKQRDAFAVPPVVIAQLRQCSMLEEGETHFMGQYRNVPSLGSSGMLHIPAQSIWLGVRGGCGRGGCHHPPGTHGQEHFTQDFGECQSFFFLLFFCCFSLFCEEFILYFIMMLLSPQLSTHPWQTCSGLHMPGCRSSNLIPVLW